MLSFELLRIHDVLYIIQYDSLIAHIPFLQVQILDGFQAKLFWKATFFRKAHSVAIDECIFRLFETEYLYTGYYDPIFHSLN